MSVRARVVEIVAPRIAATREFAVHIFKPTPSVEPTSVKVQKGRFVKIIFQLMLNVKDMPSNAIYYENNNMKLFHFCHIKINN